MSSGHWLLLHLLLGFVFGFGTFPLREPTAVSVVQPAIRTCAAQCLMTYSCVGRGTSAPILPNGFSLTDPRARRARAVPKFFFLKAFLFRFLLSVASAQLQIFQSAPSGFQSPKVNGQSSANGNNRFLAPTPILPLLEDFFPPQDRPVTGLKPYHSPSQFHQRPPQPGIAMLGDRSRDALGVRWHERPDTCRSNWPLAAGWQTAANPGLLAATLRWSTTRSLLADPGPGLQSFG